MVDPTPANLGAPSMFERPIAPHHGGMADDPVFLTGATGFLGMELLARYLERTDRQVYALVRGRTDAEATERLHAAIGCMLPDPAGYADRVVAVRGDVTRPGLGMAPRKRAEVAETVTEIVHSAASVSFSLPLDASRAINVEGTRRILDLAALAMRRGHGLRRLSHVSTAYVAGDRRGRFGEDELEVGQRFRNPYERSKFEAERLVRAHTHALPIQIFRPSIVVGEADTGWTPAFNVIYWPLRAFARGTYSAIPARMSAPVDVVPVSYVADAIHRLAGDDARSGETYNLAAGDRASTVGELLAMSAAYFGRRKPFAIHSGTYRRVVHPIVVRRAGAKRRRALRNSEVFFPYFAMRVNYDTWLAERRLRPAGIEVPRLSDYFERLMDYAVAADWGQSASPGAGPSSSASTPSRRPLPSTAGPL
jgi:long-chain acyl-CoA synthetase